MRGTMAHQPEGLPTEKHRRRQFFYETIATEFDDRMNPYDLQRRLELIAESLSLLERQPHLVLDSGCGTGPFTRLLCASYRNVIALDIAPTLVKMTRQRTGARGVTADAACLPFQNDLFDLIVSSEMIEHTPHPEKTLGELCRVLKPAGTLILTTPNRIWQPVVRLASRLHLRPFHGYENFISWSRIEEVIKANGCVILNHIGFHPWPFQLNLHRLARHVEHRLKHSRLARLMVNQLIIARKIDPTDQPSPGDDLPDGVR